MQNSPLNIFPFWTLEQVSCLNLHILGRLQQQRELWLRHTGSVTADVCLGSSPLNVRDREVCETVLYFASLQKQIS